MNQVHLLGNLTKNLELKEGKETQTPYVQFTLAVDDKKAKKDQKTYFIDVVAFRQKAKLLVKYGVKGTSLIVHGKLMSYSYTNKEDDRVYATKVLLEDFEFIGNTKRDESLIAEIAATTENVNSTNEVY